VLCHEADLEHHKGWPNAPLRPLNELVALYEQLASYLRPAKVVGVSVHCGQLSREQAAEVVARVERDTGLPTTDVIHFGADKLVDALAAHRRRLLGERDGVACPAGPARADHILDDADLASPGPQ
jgi:uncharacterized NAD-dependent epimerase/dehydratase family protein